ncbi:MAG: hypothetical protein JNM56_26080, partial [Planctomycetia bacterium]|nr:hypothetical protein [Planctomycetia bacterium]
MSEPREPNLDGALRQAVEQAKHQEMPAGLTDRCLAKARGAVTEVRTHHAFRRRVLWNLAAMAACLLIGVSVGYLAAKRNTQEVAAHRPNGIVTLLDNSSSMNYRDRTWVGPTEVLTTDLGRPTYADVDKFTPAAAPEPTAPVLGVQPGRPAFEPMPRDSRDSYLRPGEYPVPGKFPARLLTGLQPGGSPKPNAGQPAADPTKGRPLGDVDAERPAREVPN